MCFSSSLRSKRAIKQTDLQGKANQDKHHRFQVIRRGPRCHHTGWFFLLSLPTHRNVGRTAASPLVFPPAPLLWASAEITPIQTIQVKRLAERMTDSCFPLFKENWIHQELLNGCIPVSEHTPSQALCVCGVFKGAFAHMNTRGRAGDLLILIKGSQRLAVSAQQA